MSTLIFYEKPGCATNSRQKMLLARAGVEFEVRSLLAEKWTTDRLEPFFHGLPVAQWFNRAAPRVKNGEVRPEQISAAQALALMVAEPLLIRRPLLEKDEWRVAGFDWNALAPRLGIDAHIQQTSLKEIYSGSEASGYGETSGNGAAGPSLEGCSHGEHASHRCAATEVGV